jgi:hypothetical protein
MSRTRHRRPCRRTRRCRCRCRPRPLLPAAAPVPAVASAAASAAAAELSLQSRGRTNSNRSPRATGSCTATPCSSSRPSRTRASVGCWLFLNKLTACVCKPAVVSRLASASAYVHAKRACVRACAGGWVGASPRRSAMFPLSRFPSLSPRC